MGFELLSLTEPIARKQHRCQWCRERILPGEKYVRYTGIYDGFQSTAMHPECFEAMGRFDSDDDELPMETMERGGIRTKEEAASGEELK